jgi:hypothetical protein
MVDCRARTRVKEKNGEIWQNDGKVVNGTSLEIIEPIIQGYQDIRTTAADPMVRCR